MTGQTEMDVWNALHDCVSVCPYHNVVPKDCLILCLIISRSIYVVSERRCLTAQMLSNVSLKVYSKVILLSAQGTRIYTIKFVI